MPITTDVWGGPDDDPLVYRWWIYQDAGTYPGEVTITSAHQPEASVRIPTGAEGKQIHVILELRDENPIDRAVGACADELGSYAAA